MRLIDASALQEEYKKRHNEKRLMLIDVAPTVDAVPVRHGRWIDGSIPTYAVCNVCAYQERYAYENNFCPNCGARMDGKDGDENG